MDIANYNDNFFQILLSAENMGSNNLVFGNSFYGLSVWVLNNHHLDFNVNIEQARMDVVMFGLMLNIQGLGGFQDSLPLLLCLIEWDTHGLHCQAHPLFGPLQEN